MGLIAGVTCGIADEVEVFVLELAGFDVLDAAMLVELAGLVVDTELENTGELDELAFDDDEAGFDVVLAGFTVVDTKTEALEDTNRLLEVLAEPVPAFW